MCSGSFTDADDKSTQLLQPHSLLCSCPRRLSTSGSASQQVLKSVATHIAVRVCSHTQLLCSCPCRLSTSGCPSQQVLKSVATHIAVLVSSQAEYKWECVSANSGACSLLENDDYQTSVVRELKSSDFIGAEIRAGTKLMFKLYARFQNSTQESSVTEVWAAFSSVCARLRHEYMFAGAHTHARTLTHYLLLL